MLISAHTSWRIALATLTVVLTVPGLLPVLPAEASGQVRAATSGASPTAPRTADRWAPREGSHELPLPVPVTLLRPFTAPATRWGPGHRGVDLAATTGASIMAPADGVVSFAGHVVDRGVLTLTHPDGTRSSFEPVDAVVDLGAAVSRGETVATLQAGPSHCPGVPCLHWGVRRGPDYVDPLGLVAGTGPVVLLP
ncbi:M23 family metallopeptidase [Actinotalea sp. K2]|uniref:M23 family metallopeptidase n=1 Tax=Actinotalea sp. K2 TaxID=2939438 RepID=UPI002016DD28|nr:M23 family metallopeptidase [Actinotalea sp. K2]MCL3860232.1 M23 family metallopeptidase [Actinotalea sp. K2]